MVNGLLALFFTSVPEQLEALEGNTTTSRFSTLFVLRRGSGMMELSTSRIRHLDSTAGPAPRAGRLGHRRSDYLELRAVAAVIIHLHVFDTWGATFVAP